MRYPLIAISSAFSFGILIAAYLKIPFLILFTAAFLCLILSIIYIKQNIKFNIFILSAFLLLGALLLGNSQALPASHIANFTPSKGEHVYVTGIIDSDPVYRAKNTSFILKAGKLEINKRRIKTTGKVLVRVFNKKEFSYGDRLTLEGTIFRPFSFSKSFNYRAYLRHQGIYSILSVKKAGSVKYLNTSGGNPLKSFAFRIRHKMKSVIDCNLSTFSAGILNAVILGERGNLPAYAREALVKSGSVHIIAISGLHVGIVGFIILAALKMVGTPKKPRYMLTAAILIIYCIMTGARTPVARATVMAVILLLGCLFEREVNIYNSLALAGLLILAVNPWQIFEAGFQLSFLSVIFIVPLSPRINSFFPERLHKIRGVRFLILTFSVSAAAWLGVMPLVAYYFRIISPVTVLANMIIVPYMPVIVASGFSLALSGILVPPLAPVLAGSAELFILTLFKINSLLIAIPGAYFKLPRISFVYILVYYIFVILLFRSRKSRAH